MQTMPATAKRLASELSESSELSRWKLIDPETNIRLGSYYLSQLSRRFESRPESVLAAYNAGEYVVDRWQAKRLVSGRLGVDRIGLPSQRRRLT